jgi:hypothetical protein
MMRNLIVLGFAGLLMVGLSVSSMAGLPSDVDVDGVIDVSDNCLIVPNGPLLGTNSCNSQEDGNNEGYGNPCDTDTDNDGATTLVDVSATLTAAKALSTNPIFDYDCDGGATLVDLSKALADAKVLDPVGPSGLACAGTAPCP